MLLRIRSIKYLVNIEHSDGMAPTISSVQGAARREKLDQKLFERFMAAFRLLKITQKSQERNKRL